MSRTLELTLTMSLRVADDATPAMLRRQVERVCRSADMEEPLPSAPARIVAVHDPLGTLTRFPDLQGLCARFDAVAQVWTVGDVLEVCPRLSREQATTVLLQTLETHLARHGLGWDDYQAVAERLFGATAGDRSHVA
jgi:hypothetical protein